MKLRVQLLQPNNNDSELPSYTSTTQLYCSICTNEILPPEKREALPSRALLCCGREVCGDCIEENPRFGTYCPFCQSIAVKFAPTDSSGSTPTATGSLCPLPPPYTPAPPPSSYPTPVLHYIRPTDTLFSISLLYSVPLQTLRTHNRLYADTLLHACRTLEIPSPYTGPPLSCPTADEEAAEQRKRMSKRFQVRTKCADWETAEVYLSMAEWDEEAAVECWEGDERWVRENPMVKGKGKGKQAEGRGNGGG